MSRTTDINTAYEALGMSPPELAKMTTLVKEKGSFLFVSSWGCGDEIAMGTKKEVAETIDDMLRRDYDEAYDVQIVNIKTGHVVTWDFKVTVNIT